MKKSQVALIGILTCVIVISIAIIILFFTVFNKGGDKIYDVSHYIYLKFELNPNGYSAKVAKADNIVINEELVLPSKVSFEDNVYEIVEIADNGFANSGITSIEIPSTVKRIGNSAFYNCNKVNGSIEFPNGLNYIGSSAFEGCTFSGDVFIPATVNYIGSSAFKNCTFDGAVTLPTSINEIKTSTFDGCTNMKGRIDIPSNVETIGKRAFYNCKNMFQLTLTDGLKLIDEYAFYGCGMKGEVNIPTTITEVKAYSFYGCTEMTNLHFSTQTRYIRNYAFANCSNLELLLIPENVSDIGNSAFFGCTKLRMVLLDSSYVLWSIQSAASQGGLFDASYREYIYIKNSLINTADYKVPDYISSHYRRLYGADSNYPGYTIFSK